MGFGGDPGSPGGAFAFALEGLGFAPAVPVFVVFTGGLALVFGFGEPLHVFGDVGAAVRERDDVVDAPAFALAGGEAGGWGGVAAFEFVDGGAGAFDAAIGGAFAGVAVAWVIGAGEGAAFGGGEAGETGDQENCESE